MTFPKYPKYKDSGVEWLGEVPAHWAVKRLRYVAELNPSKSEVRTLPAESSVSFIPMEAVGEDGSLSLEQTRPIGEVLAGYTYVREGDVTIAKITPCFENGKGAVMRGLKNHVGFGTTELTVMRPIAGLTTSDYLYRVISSEPFRVLGESSMYGAGGQKRVPDDFVRNFSIAWPPYKEQEQIQAFLDHETACIDALVEEQQRLIGLLKEKRQAVISHAVTKGLDPDVPMKDSGVEWLGEVPAHWEVRKFFYGIKKIIDNRGRSPSYVEEGVPILEAKQLSYGGMDCASSFDKFISKDAYSEFIRDDVCVGDVLMVTVGSIGKVGVVDNQDEFVILQNIVGFRVSDDVDPGFLGIYLKSDAAFHAMQATNKDNILSSVKVSDFVQHKMPLPPRDEQLAIVGSVLEEVTRLEVLQQEAESLCTTLLERRSALISATVTGKIDVRGWQPPAGSSVTADTTQTEMV